MFQHWSLLDVLVRGLATWRLSHMLVNEDGPQYVLHNFREWTGIQYDLMTQEIPLSWPSWNPLHCVACTSVYVAVVLALFPSKMSLPLALSGIAMMVEKWHQRQ